MNHMNVPIARGNLRAGIPYVNTGKAVPSGRPRVILFLTQSYVGGNDAHATNAHWGAKKTLLDSHGMNDSVASEEPQCLKKANEVTMATAKPTLSPASSTPTTLVPSSIPLNHPRVFSQQSGRWLYFQAFETERFEFLFNFTTYDGLESSFNFLTSSEKKSGNWHFDNLSTIDDLLYVNYDFINNRIEGFEKSGYASRTMECLYNLLLPQTRAICEMLLHLPSIDGTETNGCAQLFDEKCLEFFSPPNILRLLDTYWKKWHRHCPIIHPPSFDPSQAPPELVLVMVLIGACVSKDAQDAKYARKWLDRAERLIFELPWLSQDNHNNQTDHPLTRNTKLRLLQTTIIMCALQTWEGSDKAKTRVRKLRYHYVAQASQELVYSQPGEQIGTDLAATLRHWDEFIIEEQLIRTKTYIFLLDTAFTIFYMTPPHIPIPDLDFPFSYPDSCFHACSGEEFFETVQQLCPSYPSTREMRIHQVIQMLFDTANFTSNYSLPEITDLGGFILISVNTSFIRHSPEYYTLALAKLEMIDRLHSVGQAPYIVDAGKENVKQLISDVKRVWPSRAEADNAGIV
ncbi:hypothetical protein ACHAQJ_008035 [Trichoderma viride]